MAPPHMIRVIVADDDSIVRTSLRDSLQDVGDIQIVADASEGNAAMALVARDAPDIVLYDSSLPAVAGIDAANRISKAGLSTKVVLLCTLEKNSLNLQNALDAGVMGCLLKTISKHDLIWAIRNIHNGAPVFDPAVQKHFAKKPSRRRQPHDDLTPREADILKEIARGKTNKQIAKDLDLTEGTVKGYVSVVLSKLGVADRTEAALYAVKYGLGA